MRLVEIPNNLIPPGAVMTGIRTADGLTLRCAKFMPLGACHGTVMIASGRSEYIEKYFETIGELLARGFGVVAFDWRGQGLSPRELSDRAKGHIKDFSFFQRDLEAVRTQVLEPHCPKPWFALGHSMGGAILLDQAHENRSPFARIVLIAPMIGVTSPGLRKLAGSLTALLEFIGLADTFVPGSGRRPFFARPFKGNPLTRDERRFKIMRDVLQAAPDLSIGGPTVAWAHAALRLMRRFEDADFPSQIRTPVLIFVPQLDVLADPRATERFARRLTSGRVILLKTSRHEILLEQNNVRAHFWDGFDTFIPGAENEAEVRLAQRD